MRAVFLLTGVARLNPPALSRVSYSGGLEPERAPHGGRDSFFRIFKSYSEVLKDGPSSRTPRCPDFPFAAEAAAGEARGLRLGGFGRLLWLELKRLARGWRWRGLLILAALGAFWWRREGFGVGRARSSRWERGA
jgi:hypothetical protein